MKAEPVYFVDDDEEPRELEDLGDGLAMRTPHDPGEPESVAYHVMEPQKNLELREYFLGQNPEFAQKYEKASQERVPGYEDESEYELEQLTEAIDDAARYSVEGAPIDQSKVLQEMFGEYEGHMDKLRPEKREPYGYFEMSGQPYKLINREWRMLGEDGEPLSPGEQYRRQAGMFTGKLDQNGSRR